MIKTTGKIIQVITYSVYAFRYAETIYVTGKKATYQQGCIPETVKHFIRNAKRETLPNLDMMKDRYRYT